MRKTFTKLCFVASALLWCTAAFAQSKTVTGRVVDNDDHPLAGATVVVKGTSRGTSTDANGIYSITASGSEILQFTCMGNQPAEEQIGDRTVINVKLLDDAQTIDAVEVVSDGYSTISRRDLTGSIAQADMKSIMKTNVTSFDQALTGRVAGVVVTSSDGAVGAESTIIIRGNNSITQSSAPLYVVDGFPMESSFANSINMADIKNIDVLKDASATAIYGARGANGVIVITTKEGTGNKLTVNFSGSLTAGKIANKAELMDPYDFVLLQYDMSQARGTSSVNDFNRRYLSDCTLEDYKTMQGYDWQDEVYRSTLTQNYSVSVQGSNPAGTRYHVTFGALDQQGIIVNSTFKRYQGRINFTQPIAKNMLFNLNVNYTHSVTGGVTPTDAQASYATSGWLIYSLWGYRPVTPPGVTDLYEELYDPDVSGNDDYRFNPAVTVRNEYRNTLKDYLNVNSALTFTLAKDLKLKVSGGYILNNTKREEFNGSMTYSGNPRSNSGRGVNGAIYWTEINAWQNDNTLTWTKKITGGHNLTTLAGFSMSGEKRSYKGVAANQIKSEGLGVDGIYTGELQSVIPYQRDWTLVSFLGRINYHYKYRYYLTASFRADGSSKFPVANRWGYFPSVGASWNFNREEFLKNQSWLSNGKIRVSWGFTGNNRTQTPYDFYPQITTLPGSGNSVDYVFGGDKVSGYYVSNLGYDKLKWETTDQFNVGADVGFLKNRITVTFDWYVKNTRDLLLNATLPPSSGSESAMMNIGSIRNKGIEFTLSTVNVASENFQWTSSFNIAFNRNTVTGLASGQRTITSSISWSQEFNNQTAYISEVGGPTGLMYGFIYEGTYKASDFDETGVLRDGIPYVSSLNRSNVRPGDPKYRDMNGDGEIDDYDRTVIGRGQPIHTGGFNNTFTWKGFDLNVFLSWSYGNDVLNVNRLIFEDGLKLNTNALRSYNGRWSESNPDSDIPRVNANATQLYSSRVVEDASFLRVKNISLGYTLPQRAWLRKAGISSLRIYVSADNMFTFTGYSGPDPEVSTRNSVLTPGFDWSAYPRSKSVTGGVNISF